MNERRVAKTAQIDEAHSFDIRCRALTRRDSQSCLAHSAEPRHRHEPRLSEQALDVFELVLPPDEAREGRWQVVPSGYARDRGYLMSQNRLLQATQLLAGLEPQFSREHVSGPAICRQGVHLPAAPIQREHELPPQTLAQRMLGDELLEFGDEPLVATDLKLRFDSFLEGFEAQLGQPRNLCLCERLVHKVGIRIPPPQRKALGEPVSGLRRSLLRERLTTLGQVSFEPHGVELAGIERERVPSRPPFQPRADDRA